MAESKTAVVAAFLGNGALAVLKGIAAASTGSAAMLAETFHSIGVKRAVGGVTQPRLVIVEPTRPGADTFGMVA